MRLDQQWKLIVRKAWSIRLAIIAALLSGLEVVVPMFGDVIPRNTFAALSFVVAVSAAVARVVAQKDFDA